MAMVSLNLRPERRELRQFGLIALIAFGLLGGLIDWRGGLPAISFGESASTVAYVLWGIGAVSALFSLIAPAANRPLYVGLMVISFPIGLVVSHVVLGAFFYGILTPVGLVFLLIGRDSLKRRFEPDAKTYWVDHNPPDTMKRYFRQF